MAKAINPNWKYARSPPSASDKAALFTHRENNQKSTPICITETAIERNVCRFL